MYWFVLDWRGESFFFFVGVEGYGCHVQGDFFVDCENFG